MRSLVPKWMIPLAVAAAFCQNPSVAEQNPAPAAGAPPAVAQQENLWQYMLPQAKIIGGVDWKRAKNSDTGRMIVKRLLSDAKVKSQMSSSGMDFIDTFDQLLFSAPAAEEGSSKQNGVAAILGKIDRAKLRKSMPDGTGVERFKGIDLFVPPSTKGEDMVAGLVSDELMLLGDRASIGQVLDSRSGLRDAALLERAQQMESRHEIWLLADAPPAMAAGSTPAAQGLDDIHSMDLGLSLRQGLGMTANLQMRDAEKAQGIAMLAQMLSSLQPAQGPGSALTPIAKNLAVKVEGSAVRMSLQVPLAQLERAALEMKSGLETTARRTLESFVGVSPAGGGMPGLRSAVKANGQQVEPVSPVAVVAPREPEPPRTRTIKIVGLEEGDKEITYTTGGKK